ncbi:MAG TPA: hypothetical protein VFL31_07125 [Nitrospiraceae bacterium]|nr:hypothetical protein [Nitrospiraceae bacterium]
MYAIELPKELLWRLARLRERNRKPIARQVREVVEAYCQEQEAMMSALDQVAGEEATDDRAACPKSTDNRHAARPDLHPHE